MKPIIIQTPVAEAHIYTHGAHVTHFQPRGQKPVLFLSAQARFEAGKPIRGGVPICFPWFGPKEDAPAHGTARISEWKVAGVKTQKDGAVVMAFAYENARFQVTVGETLTMELEVRNDGQEPYRFEEALHTYLAVGDVREVSVEGLACAEYLDQVEGFKRKREGATPIRITAETDRTYLNTRSTCIVSDPVWNRRLIVEKTGSDSTVVWNPWIERSKAFKDLGDEEWPGFLCVETCNVKENAVMLAPGQTHILSAVIASARLLLGFPNGLADFFETKKVHYGHNDQAEKNQ